MANNEVVIKDIDLKEKIIQLLKKNKGQKFTFDELIEEIIWKDFNAEKHLKIKWGYSIQEFNWQTFQSILDEMVDDKYKNIKREQFFFIE